MSDPRHRLGRAGEAQAEAYLRSRGYRILGRNVRAGGVEIDLVVAGGGCVVFVEVKTRRGGRAGAPEEAVDARKQARLRRGAAAWLRETRPRLFGARRARFDVVTCRVQSARWSVEHWEDAF